MKKYIVTSAIAALLCCGGRCLAEALPQFVRQITAPGLMSYPQALAMTPNGELLVTDVGTKKLLKCSPDGTCSEFYTGTLQFPLLVTATPDGAVYLYDDAPVDTNKRTIKISASGGYLDEIAHSYWEPRDPVIPSALLGLRNGSLAVLDDGVFSGLLVYSPNMELLEYWGSVDPATQGWPAGTYTYVQCDVNSFGWGFGLVQSPADGYYISTLPYFGGIKEYAADGTNYGDVVSGLSNPSTYIAIDAAGSLYVTMVDHVQKFTAGQLQYTLGTTGSGNGQFLDPKGIAVDSNGYIYVADKNNHRIQVFQGDAPVATEVTSWGELKAAFR